MEVIWFNKIKKRIQEPAVRQFLWFCLPGLLIAVVVRLWISVKLPYGILQYDTPDFLLTAREWLENSRFKLHGKKTFLAPLLFTLPFVLKLPVLMVIPALQHLLGVIMVGMVGGLVRLWFVRWRWWIVPVTLVVALDPATWWYEHTLLGEFLLLFFVVAIALTATLFLKNPSWSRFLVLIGTLFLTAGSRPEGKLFFAFGLFFTALIFWGKWREWSRRMAVMALAAGFTFQITKTHQAGLLLYASVIHLTPDTLKTDPQFSPVIQPLRDQLRNGWKVMPMDLVNVAKQLHGMVKAYMKNKPVNEQMDPGPFCQRLALEAMQQNPAELPWIAISKFLQCMDTWTSGGFDRYWLHDKQIRAFTREKWVAEKLMPGLTGKEIHTVTDTETFIRNYYPISNPDWLSEWLNFWFKIQTHWRLPDFTITQVTGVKPVDFERGEMPPPPRLVTGTAHIYGMPYFYLFALAGMLVTMVFSFSLLLPHGLWKLQVAWGIMLLGLWFVIWLTGVVEPRYRFVFDLFGWIYCFLLLDRMSGLIPRGSRKNPIMVEQKFDGT